MSHPKNNQMSHPKNTRNKRPQENQRKTICGGDTTVAASKSGASRRATSRGQGVGVGDVAGAGPGVCVGSYEIQSYLLLILNLGIILIHVVIM